MIFHALSLDSWNSFDPSNPDCVMRIEVAVARLLSWTNAVTMTLHDECMAPSLPSMDVVGRGGIHQWTLRYSALGGIWKVEIVVVRGKEFVFLLTG